MQYLQIKMTHHQHICPDKIWDLKYNKNNKLLGSSQIYQQEIHKNEQNNQQKLKILENNNNNNNNIINNNNNNYNKNDDNKNNNNKYSRRIHGCKASYTSSSTPKLRCLNRNVFYLFTLTFYCCCVLIAATPGLGDSPSESLTKYNTSNSSINSNNISGGSKNTSSNNNKDNGYSNIVHKKNNSNIVIRNSTMQNRSARDASNMPDDEYEYIHETDEELDEYELLITNKSARGKYIGAPCDLTCDATLHHVFCDPATFTCSCDKNYPVIIGLTRGCAKPKKLGDTCFYHQTCIYNDENSLCVQVSHNAKCECADGFHSVSYTKPTRRVFCTQDIAVLTSDLPTLLGVTTGIAVLAGLICMVLHLFSKTKYPRHRNFADANIPPPIMYSSDTGIPLTVQSGRPSSRSSLRSSGSIGSYGNRRPSSAPNPGSKGVLVSTSRTGSRRPSLASIHSTSSSVRSYSMMRFEKEIQQKEIRSEMKLRLARLHQQQYFQQNKPQIIVGEISHGAMQRITAPTPSPLTPNSTDELLPSVDESLEFSPKLEKEDAVYNGPCTSFNEAL